jgi:MFS family permease
MTGKVKAVPVHNGYILTLALVALASTVGKCIMCVNMSIDSLSALAITADESISTLPLVMMQLGSVVASTPAAFLMARCGRRVGFITGAGFFIAGAALGALALELGSFPLQLCAVCLTGVGESFCDYLRFAAAEVAPDALKARAVSIVIATSVLGGFVGPEVAKATAGSLDIEFQGSYATNAAISILYLVLVAVATIRLPTVPTRSPMASDSDASEGHRSHNTKGCEGPRVQEKDRSPWRQYRWHTSLCIATLSCAIGFGTMTLTMTAMPLAMKARGFSFAEIATTYQTHAVRCKPTMTNTVAVNTNHYLSSSTM